MAPKRPLDSEIAQESSKAAKKAKTKAARMIDIQPTENTAAGPSRPRPTVRFTADSLKGLPNSIDVEKFAEARSFEVGAMQKAMQTAREDASKRVWQTLPRHMRRRTASHDSTRVPVRLREKARAEMDPVKKKKKLNALPKRGRTDIGRTAKLLKRQQEKTWLETHIWHAKRMKMENLWGHRLALHPTEKAFRPSHRAALHGSIVQDVSYYGILEIHGPEDLVKDVLSRCCDPESAIFLHCYTSGARACDTHLYQNGSYPYGLICPSTLIWRPIDATAQGIESAGSAAARAVWLHVHPSVFLDVHAAIQTATSDVIAGCSRQGSEIEITDLRGSLNAFEIIGPRASQVLTGALKVTKDAGSGKKAWNLLAKISSSASMPKGMVIGLQVFDPRLSFPPSNTQLQQTDEQSSGPTFAVAPSAEIALSEIWQEKVREKLRKPQFTKKDLDERRSKNFVPGTRLQPQASDARIPILLIQRSISPTCGSSSSSGVSESQMHGYLLLFPAGWSTPFWSSITHTGTRVGGLREHKSQRFESGTPHFPEDYVGTQSYDLYWEKRAAEAGAKWERTPKAKRPPYDRMPTSSRSPRQGVLWKPDWIGILGLVAKQDSTLVERQPDLIPTQRPDDMDRILDSIIQEGASELQEDGEVAWEGIGGNSNSSGPDHQNRNAPWVLHGTHATALLSTLASSASSHLEVLHHINGLRVKRGLRPLPEDVAEDLTKSALVTVKIEMCGRGTPEDLSVVYDASGDLGDQGEGGWRKLMTEAIENGMKHDNDELGTISTPDPSQIIGYITSGSFSLMKGKGAALGAVSLLGLLRIIRRDMKYQRRKQLRQLVLVRSRGSPVCRLAWIVINNL